MQQHYLDSHQSQMSAGQPYAAQSTTAGGMTQYPPYQQHQQQPPVLQPGPATYAPSSASYAPQYSYANGMPSPHGATPVSSHMGPHLSHGLPPLPTMAAGGPSQHTFVGSSSGPSPTYQQQASDPTGQLAPSGMKPRVTATLWEDEGCMCFQIEAKGVCVARRDDNHMINGTKLLNVAGMTRGRRDGILKSEKNRHVVKIGPMHLKGVWIPFDRALDFANKEKITESLYPLFVHNVGALLYHPTNQSRTNAVMAAADRRRLDNSKQQGGMPSTTQPPTLTHHHSMNSTVGSQQPHSIAPHPTAGRPGLDRAHTFPTPPTSASGTNTGLSSQGSSYDWTNNNIGNGVQTAQPLMMDNHAHSTPATPASTPPGSSLPSLQPYQSHQTYDSSRPMYSTATAQQPLYAQHGAQQHGMSHGGPLSSGSYKQEMGPPHSRGPGSRPESEQGDIKLDPYGRNQASEQGGRGAGEEEAEHEQDSEYAHENSHAYPAHRGSYSSYSSGTNLTSYNGDHVTPEVNGSSAMPNGSSRGLPRASNGTQPQWASGYHTPPHAPTSTSLYNPTSDTRGTLSNGNSSNENYVTGAYAPTQMNGSNKRMRDDDDDSQPTSRSDDFDSLKRRKMSREGSTNGTVLNGSFDDKKSLHRTKSSATARSRR